MACQVAGTNTNASISGDNTIYKGRRRRRRKEIFTITFSKIQVPIEPNSRRQVPRTLKWPGVHPCGAYRAQRSQPDATPRRRVVGDRSDISLPQTPRPRDPTLSDYCVVDDCLEPYGCEPARRPEPRYLP